MPKNILDEWIQYCKDAWLADCDITEFTNCEIEQINVLTQIYNHLDFEYQNKAEVSDYKDPLFYMASYKLDKRH